MGYRTLTALYIAFATASPITLSPQAESWGQTVPPSVVGRGMADGVSCPLIFGVSTGPLGRWILPRAADVPGQSGGWGVVRRRRLG